MEHAGWTEAEWKQGHEQLQADNRARERWFTLQRARVAAVGHVPDAERVVMILHDVEGKARAERSRRSEALATFRRELADDARARGLSWNGASMDFRDVFCMTEAAVADSVAALSRLETLRSLTVDAGGLPYVSTAVIEQLGASISKVRQELDAWGPRRTGRGRPTSYLAQAAADLRTAGCSERQIRLLLRRYRRTYSTVARSVE